MAGADRKGQAPRDGRPPGRILLETAAVLAVTVVPSLLLPSAKLAAAFVPLLYLLIERPLRGRSWADLGFKATGFMRALARNGYLITIVVAIQPVILLAAKAWWPEWLEHVSSRLPVPETGGLVLLFGLLPVGLLMEEMVYRSLFQQRMSWFIGTPAAVALISPLFGLMHYAGGDPRVVAVDIGLVALDGAFFGIIFARGSNIWVAWLAHVLADVAGIGCLELTAGIG